MKARNQITAACVAFLAFLLVACSNSPPRIAQTFWQINLVHNPSSGVAHERLSFFVHVTDSEGISDLDSISLLNDRSELYWRFDSSNWQYTNRDGELWVGSNDVQMTDGSAMPRGNYRVLVNNLAGERATGDIFVSAEGVAPKQADFPTVDVGTTTLTVRSSRSDTTLWLYDQRGRLVSSRQIQNGSVPISALAPSGKGRRGAVSLYVYAYDRDCGCGLINGPYALDIGE